MEMHDPGHPGKILRELWITPLGLTITETAKALGVTRKALSDIVNGHAGISPKMAVRLSKAFNTTAEIWMEMQIQYDLWHAKRNERNYKVSRLIVA